jgi:hypothetical protein
MPDENGQRNDRCTEGSGQSTLDVNRRQVLQLAGGVALTGGLGAAGRARAGNHGNVLPLGNGNGPQPPSDLVASGDADSIDLSWDYEGDDDDDDDHDLSKFRIYRGTGVDADVDPEVYDEVAASTMQYEDEDVDAAKTYFYGVRAVNESGKESSISPLAVATPAPEDGQTTIAAGDASVTVGQTETVPIVVSNLSSGLAGFNLSLSVVDDEVAHITEVAGPELGAVNTALEGAAATISAEDTTGEVSTSVDAVQVGAVTVEGAEPGETQLVVEVESLVDDDGSAYAPATKNGRIVVSPERAPLDEDLGQPKDPDLDGRYEDVNGNGRVDYDDVVTLSEKRESEMVLNNTESFDFTGDDEVDAEDLVALLEEV